MGGGMSITGRDAFGNAKKTCDFGCGEEGTITLDDVGGLHGCMNCVLRAARRKCVERLIKIDRKARSCRDIDCPSSEAEYIVAQADADQAVGNAWRRQHAGR
jgi:hypothetical protein